MRVDTQVTTNYKLYTPVRKIRLFCDKYIDVMLSLKLLTDILKRGKDYQIEKLRHKLNLNAI